MADHTVRIELSFGARSLRCLMAAAMIFSAVSELASENVTLTTYYPAPSGVYAQMITTGDTRLARDGGQVSIGAPSAYGGAKLDVKGAILAAAGLPDCSHSGQFGFSFEDDGCTDTGMFSSGDGVLRFYTNSLPAMIMNGGNVGIGTADTSAAALTVNGGIKVGDTANCTQPGILTWSSGKLRVCDGSQFLIVNTTLPPPAAPSIADASATGQVGVWFEYQISGSNGPTSYDASPLPSGLSVNTTSGRISGKPTREGTTSVAIKATNAGGTGTATLTLTVNPAPITPGTLDGSCAYYYEHSQPAYPATNCWFFGVWGMGGGPGANCANGWTPTALDGTIKQSQTSRGCPPQTSGNCDVYSPMCRKD